MPRRTVNKILEQAYERGLAAAAHGEVATYIPELSKANPLDLGISLCLPDGTRYEIGDVEKRFTIQSISKVISLGCAIQRCGAKAVFSKVGMEPSGEAFNSLVELDLRTSRPLNPMINSGAITVASLLKEVMTFNEFMEITRKVCNDPDIDFNEAVYRSEKEHLSRNRSIAYLLESKGIITTGVEESLDFYTKMCSMNVTARSLASLGVTLAMDGQDPFTGEQLFPVRTAEIVKTIMLTCGMYDSSGEFAVFVGIPTKSGVGGGLLSAADDRIGIGVYGPSLDEKGNCIAGRPVLELLSEELELHIFDKTDVMDEIRKAEARDRAVAKINQKIRDGITGGAGAAGENGAAGASGAADGNGDGAETDDSKVSIRTLRHKGARTFMPFNVKDKDKE
ncbi:MAG: glutaminase A [Firmicutes bacterium]|nr:glutaminase A [Bacillota bacterium]